MVEIPEEVPQITQIQQQCSAMYNAMDENSEILSTPQGDVKVWSGYIGATADSVGIPEGVRTRVVRRLADIGSIQLIDQGRRNVRTTVALLAPPTADLWAAYDAQNPQSDLTAALDPAILAQEVRSVKKLVGEVDIPNALANFEGRIAQLEVEVKKLSKQLAERVVNEVSS